MQIENEYTKSELKIHNHVPLVSKRGGGVALLFLFFLFSLNILVLGQDITYHQAPNTTQNNTKKSKNDDILKRISVGGSGGLSIGQITAIGIFPHAAYHFNDFVCVGIGGSYSFYNNNYYKYTDHIFGIKVFTEAHFLRFLGVHAAYQALNYKNPVPSIEKDRIWSNNLSLGGGYYQKMGRVAMYFYVLYNWSDRPPKENILYELGFSYFLK